MSVILNITVKCARKPRWASWVLQYFWTAGLYVPYVLFPDSWFYIFAYVVNVWRKAGGAGGKKKKVFHVSIACETDSSGANTVLCVLLRILGFNEYFEQWIHSHLMWYISLVQQELIFHAPLALLTNASYCLPQASFMWWWPPLMSYRQARHEPSPRAHSHTLREYQDTPHSF